MWFDRLYAIDQGSPSKPLHGNYFSDPASIGLVDRAARTLTQAGQSYLSFRSVISNNPLRAEYELLKIIYFSNQEHQESVRQFLEAKREHLLSALDQFVPTQSRHIFLMHPRLLVIVELLSGFPGAIARLIRLPEADLLALKELGEAGFASLCDGPGFPAGLARLCRRIGSDYTRGEERRLHYLISMALLTIAQTVPPGRAKTLTIPLPFANLLTEIDIYTLHAQYTSDINVWFDDVNFQVSSSLGSLPSIPALVPAQLNVVNLHPQTGTPVGVGSASPTDQRRRKRRAAKRIQTTIMIDNVLSERAEDVAEERILRQQYGPLLIRAGHRIGERLALPDPDGMVPGADFYVLNTNNEPIAFVEIKSVTGNPPFEVAFTRAEYLRAVKCANAGLPYRLILVEVASAKFYEVWQFATSISNLQISEAVQFVIQITP